MKQKHKDIMNLGKFLLLAAALISGFYEKNFGLANFELLMILILREELDQ